MMVYKRFLFLLCAALCAVSAVTAQTATSQSTDSQSADSESEMSIEESYLQEAIELMIIQEASKSDSREQKMLALEHIGSALERGNSNDEIRVTLEYLSLEGTHNKIMQGKRLVNDYPDVRRQAAKYLGNVGTKEAKNALIRICISESEPLVIQEAIKSLGVIGMNENNDASNAIIHATGKLQNTNTADNLVAIAALEALEQLAEKNKSADVATIQLITRITDGPYAPPVKARAKQVLANMYKSAAQGKSQKSQ